MEKKQEKFPELRRFAQIMDRFFEDPFQDFLGFSSIRTNVYDTKDNVIIEADLPGFSKDQISIDIIHHGIKIKAVQQQATELKDETRNIVRQERSNRTLERTIPLTVPVYPESTSASYQNGVLTIEVRKQKTNTGSHPTIEIDG